MSALDPDTPTYDSPPPKRPPARLQKAAQFIDERPVAAVLWLVGVLTAVRLLLLFVYDTSLGPDEAQYWLWSRDFDWGYYSKPPMIAWVIGLSTGLAGTWEPGVRLLSPVFIGGTALCLFATARQLYGDRVGLWSALTWLLLPAVILGSTLMSTDIPLLFFWSLALLFLVRLADAPVRRGGREALGLGMALGLGLLSKYAMVYFFLGWTLAAIVSPFARRSVRPRPVFIALVTAALLFAPNLVWNVRNGLQTLSHTADNADWDGGFRLHWQELGQFLGDQFGVFGPVLFLVLFVYVATLPFRTRAAGANRGRDLFVLSFALPPIFLICCQALLSRAHANWAMTAYPAATILVCAYLVRARMRWVLGAANVIHAVAGTVLVAILLHFPLADSLGLSNAVKRLRGWEAQAAAIAEAAPGYDAVVFDDREVAAHLVWEWREREIPVRVFDLNGRPDNTYEYEFPFLPTEEGRYLLVRYWPQGLCRYDTLFDRREQGQAFVDLNAERRGRPERTFDLYELTNYDPSATPPC